VWSSLGRGEPSDEIAPGVAPWDEVVGLPRLRSLNDYIGELLIWPNSAADASWLIYWTD